MSACEQEVLGTLRRERCQTQHRWAVRKRNTASSGGGTCPLGTSACGILVREGYMSQGSQCLRVVMALELKSPEPGGDRLVASLRLGTQTQCPYSGQTLAGWRVKPGASVVLLWI